MTSGWQGASLYFKSYGRELVSKPAISLKKGWGGATVERLTCSTTCDVLVSLLVRKVVRGRAKHPMVELRVGTTCVVN